MSQSKRVNRTELVLRCLAGAGMVAAAMLAPNALRLLGGTGWPRQKIYGYRRVIRKLQAAGLIEFKKNRRGTLVARLTPRGRQKLARYELGKLAIKVPRRWDGKYRVIIFDIKETRRAVRDELRAWLEKLGFLRLQNSVWVHPYDCEEVVTLLKADFRVGRDVLYLVVEQIENDRWLKKSFGLA